MATVTVYGIANCDTVKKARRWLGEQGVGYRFHDFRKDGLTRETVETWLGSVPADKLLNRRGTTWRRLDTDEQARADTDLAGLLVDYPSLIKRPVIVQGDRVLVGFGEEERATLAP